MENINNKELDTESRLEKNLREYVISKGHVPTFSLTTSSWVNLVPFNEDSYFVPIGNDEFCKVPSKTAEKCTNLGALSKAIDEAQVNNGFTLHKK